MKTNVRLAAVAAAVGISAQPVAAALPEGAAALGRIDFEGRTLEYRRVLDSSGGLTLVGRDKALGKRFRLRVRADGAVTGTVGTTPVRFSVSRETRDRAVREMEPELAQTAEVAQMADRLPD